MKTFAILIVTMSACSLATAMSRPKPAPPASPLPLSDSSQNQPPTNAIAPDVQANQPADVPQPPSPGSPADRPTVPTGLAPTETGPGIIIIRGTMSETNAPANAGTETPANTGTITPPIAPMTPRSGGGQETIPGTSGYGSGR